jgi:hypothetical protein
LTLIDLVWLTLTSMVPVFKTVPEAVFSLTGGSPVQKNRVSRSSSLAILRKKWIFARLFILLLPLCRLELLLSTLTDRRGYLEPCEWSLDVVVDGHLKTCVTIRLKQRIALSAAYEPSNQCDMELTELDAVQMLAWTNHVSQLV